MYSNRKREINMKASTKLKQVALVPLIVLCAGLSTASHAAIDPYVIVAKDIENIQTSASNVQVNPAPQSPTYGGPYGFGVNVFDANSITAPVVSGPISVGEPFFNSGSLLFSNPDGYWRLGSPNANDWGSPTLGDLNSKFGSGVYTVNVNGTPIPLNLTGDAYPNTPMVILSGGTWSGGKYVIDVGNALTITTNVFSAYGTHPDDVIDLGIDGIIDTSQFHSDTPGANFLSFTLPAFSLTSGQDYNGNASFTAVVDSNSIGAPIGKLNAAIYGADTGFTISAVPEPAAMWQMTSGLMLIGLGSIFRKRKSA
jgi:hypothetical protein